MTHHIHICEHSPAIRPERLVFGGWEGDYQCYMPDEVVDYHLIDTIVIRSAVAANAQFLSRYPQLQTICRVGAGTDHIDSVYCQEHDIRIINTPGANAIAVADFTLWAILSGLRHTHQSYPYEQRHRYEGRDLCSQSVCLIGYGRIGRAVAQRLLAFGVSEIKIYDPYVDPQSLDDHRLVYCHDKTTALSSADIVSLHIPYTNQNHHFLSETDFLLLSDKSIIINTARGGLIDELALLDYLDQNHHAQAYLDVWSQEPQQGPLYDKLSHHPRIVVTPHIATMTSDALVAMHHFICS